MTPEELALLQQQQEEGIVPPVEVSTGSGILPAIHDTLFDPTQKTDLLTGTMTDVNGELPPTTDVPPLVSAPQPPVASDHDKLAAAKVVLGTSNLDQTEKVGEKTTQKSQVVESQQSKDAQAQLDKAEKSQQAATDLQLQGATDQANIDYQKQKEYQGHVAEIENARVQVHHQKQAELEDTLRDLDNRVTELANYKPETFWGSKSAADKITAGISVGLGSFGQALLGSGQNVGTMLLNRQMDEFDNNQKAQYRAKADAIGNMRADITVKRNLLEDLDKTFDAQKLAANAQVLAKFAKADSMAKTMQVKAGIMKQMAEFDQRNAMDKATIAAKYEQHIMSTTKQDVIEKVKAGSPRANAKEINEQVKSIDTGTTALIPIRNEIATGLKQLQDPKLSDEQKYQVAQGLIKTMNSTQGKDAVGADEREALASELESSFGTIGTATKYGAAGGAAIGGAAAAIPTVGLGAPVGAGIGALVGGTLGAAGATVNEMFKPGGIKLTPQIGTFTQRAKLILDKLDGTLSRNDKVKELVKQGIPASKAAVMVDTEPK